MTDDKMIRLVDALNVPFPPDWLDRANGFQGGLKMQVAWRDGFYACLNAIEALNTGKEVMPPAPVNSINITTDIGPGGQDAVAGAALDADLYGTGFMLDGEHVPHEDVYAQPVEGAKP